MNPLSVISFLHACCPWYTNSTQATLPKYLIRAFGCGTPIGLIYAINPTMILLLVPIVGAVTGGFHHFDMIHCGGYLSALSPLWIVAFNTRARLWLLFYLLMPLYRLPLASIAACVCCP